MPETVLVTGAMGLVGSATLQRLVKWGFRVIATDLDTPDNRAAAADLSDKILFRWGDLTDRKATAALVSQVRPDAIIHLAAVIPPGIFANPTLARKVNVDATGYLVAAAESLSKPPRFIQASSVAVHGSRNPFTRDDLLSATTPLRPTDIYGSHKATAEMIVRNSELEWVVLRLGGVMSTTTFPFSKDHLAFEAMLPSDNRIQTVDVRDVAAAFTAAVDSDAVKEIFMIGGDDATHRLRQGDLGPSIAGALGLVGGIPRGRSGDPARDDDWFTTDWMDTTRAQEALGFQQHTWPDMLAEISATAGPKRHLLRPAAPLVRAYLTRKWPYRGHPGTYADLRGALTQRWGPTAISTTLHDDTPSVGPPS